MMSAIHEIKNYDSLFEEWTALIGRFQPFHKGHKALVHKLLDEGKRVCIMCRMMPVNRHNPFPPIQVLATIRAEFVREIREEKVMVMSIPNIKEVAHGRDPGWEVYHIDLPEKYTKISASDIRRKLRGE